jgi:dephospho-CoA kinase
MSKKKIVIGITGNIGSGKGTITKYLTQKHKASTVAYTNILKDILERLHLVNERKNLANLAESLRNTFGADILSKVLEKDIQNQGAEIIVFDGIRKKAELDYFKNKVDNFFFVFVDVPIKITYERLIKRGEKTDDLTKTFAEFQKDQLRPADKDVPGLKKYADFVIDNSASLGSAHQQVDNIMQKIKRKK